MRHSLVLYVFLWGLLFQGFEIIAQESNYANYEVGSKATMLGGAVVAGVNNISTVFYNPGALSFLEKKSLSLETSTVFGGGLTIKNGAGQDINIKASFFDVIPSLLGGVVINEKKPNWVFGYSSITVNSSFIEFNIRKTMFANIIPSSPGLELYEGLYDYSNKIRENWIGATASRKINDQLGIGVSLFGVYYSQQYSLRQSATVSVVSGDTISVALAHSSIQRDLRFGSFGFIIKVGAAYKWEDNRIGLTVTTPMLNLDILGKGDISQTFLVQVPSIGLLPFDENLYGNKLTTYHYTPIEISFGYERTWLNSKWSFSMTYFTPISEYPMLATDPQIFTQPPLTKPSLKAYDQARQIVNVSIGVMEALRDGLSFLAGARTDLNYSSSSFLDSDKFVPKMSYWNLYHITGGVVWFNEKAHVTLGGDYAFGVSKGDLQQVNLSDPTEEGLLFGEKTTNTRTFYNQINVVLGFSYSF